MLRHGLLVIDLLASGNRRGWNENIYWHPRLGSVFGAQ